MKLNIHLFVFVLIALIALLTDYIIYILGAPYLSALIISFVIIAIISFFLIKNKKIKIELNWNSFDLLFLGILALYILSRIFTPDFSYDVSNYHIYLQQCFPIDKINFDFFAGKTLNAFLFPLGDRMFYIFRYFLGYKAGTILSFYSIVVAYYEVKKILRLSFNNKKLVPIFSIFCVFSSTIVNQWLGTYYIDIFSIPLILEIIYMLLDYKKNINNKSSKIVLIGLLSGILTAIKVTNIIIIFPIIIWALFILKPNKKSIIPIILSIAGFITPIFIYALDNYLQTGSIIFPYYNNIFKSRYFGLFSWVDPRFGIDSLFKAIIWPIYVSVINLGYGDDWIIKEYIWAIGFVITIGFFIYSLIRRFKTRNDKNNIKYESIYTINNISLVLTIIWILLLQGYMRYALVIPVLYSIVISYIIIKAIAKIKYKKIVLNTIYVLFAISIMIFTGLQINYIANYPKGYLFNDIKAVTIHIDGVWGTIGDSSALSVLVREEGTPIYNLDKSTIDTSEITLEMYYDKIENSDIYILMDDYSFKYKNQLLEQNNFKLGELIRKYNYKKLPYLDFGNTAYLYKLEYVGGNK